MKENENWFRRLLRRIGEGLHADANMREHNKTGRYLSDDAEFPNTYRPELKSKTPNRVKTVAATVLIAATAATAQAGQGAFGIVGGDETVGGSNWFANIVAWVRANQSLIMSGAQNMDRPSPEALANMTADQLREIQVDHGPATPTIYQTKQK